MLLMMMRESINVSGSVTRTPPVPSIPRLLSSWTYFVLQVLFPLQDFSIGFSKFYYTLNDLLIIMYLKKVFSKRPGLNASSSGFPRHGSVTSAIRKSIKSKTRRWVIDHLNAFNNRAFFFFFQNQQPRPLLMGTQHRQVKNSISL